MGIVIDTNVLINEERGKSGLREAIGNAADSECHLSVITMNELLHGLFRAPAHPKAAERRIFLTRIFSRFRILNIDQETAEIHAVLWADLVSRNEMIGVHDSWIAATCLQYGHELEFTE
jgi:tRNA(fMet)-specific endonuclease VapC